MTQVNLLPFRHFAIFRQKLFQNVLSVYGNAIATGSPCNTTDMHATKQIIQENVSS